MAGLHYVVYVFHYFSGDWGLLGWGRKFLFLQLLVANLFIVCLNFLPTTPHLGYRAKKNANPESDEQLTGGRTLSGVPVALSCTASFMSAVTILGTPVEIYNYGTMYYYSALTYLCVACIVAGVFLPVMYDLNLAKVLS